MSRPRPISGFPEWLPGQRLIEQYLLDRLRATFELYGYAPIETRAVEPLDQLLRKGETSKEVYLLRRLQAEAGEEDGGDADGLGLHFDLTVPLARYVLEHAGKLPFPFRRYQIQKVWRGERPQEGRYREFLQADFDVVDRDTLPAHYEVEMPLVLADALADLPIGEPGRAPILIQVNNRKVCEGFYRGLGIEDTAAVLRAVDRLDRIGPAGVVARLVGAGVTEAQAKAALSLGEISAADGSFVDAVRALGVSDPLLDEGLAELVRVVETAAEHAPGLCRADLRIARGLDYYTGTVYETQLLGYERFGSICSGGRYDNLASSGTDRFPGVGLSLGVSRLLGVLFGAGALTISRPVPTCVLVALPAEADRAAGERTAGALRRRGIATEVAPAADRYGKQIRYADRRGIPYVWFPGAPGEPDTVKDIRSGDQVEADPATWQPPADDLRPRVTGS